jgi:nucleotide-binding universal stress UspA family protein
MTTQALRTVFHPSDFSEASEVAFGHALKLALTARATLTMMHVYAQTDSDWGDFPGVRRTLERWGLLPTGSLREDVGRLGLEIDKVRATHPDPVRSVLGFLETHPADLIVLATRRQHGKVWWADRSVAKPIARGSGLMTLFLPEKVEGFVSWKDGSLSLRSVLVPVTSQPAPEPSVEAALRLGEALGIGSMEITLLHVGNAQDAPRPRIAERPGWRWKHAARQGDVVGTILETASQERADLIVMTTAGHDGFLDALRGSTSERVLHSATCPVLAVPAHDAGPMA